MDDTARLLAVEELLTDPEALNNDALEGDLYILRDQLRATRPTSPPGRNETALPGRPACHHGASPVAAGAGRHASRPSRQDL